MQASNHLYQIQTWTIHYQFISRWISWHATHLIYKMKIMYEYQKQAKRMNHKRTYWHLCTAWPRVKQIFSMTWVNVQHLHQYDVGPCEPGNQIQIHSSCEVTVERWAIWMEKSISSIKGAGSSWVLSTLCQDEERFDLLSEHTSISRLERLNISLRYCDKRSQTVVLKAYHC
jgi:hypothetical protein